MAFFKRQPADRDIFFNEAYCDDVHTQAEIYRENLSVAELEDLAKESPYEGVREIAKSALRL